MSYNRWRLRLSSALLLVALASLAPRHLPPGTRIPILAFRVGSGTYPSGLGRGACGMVEHRAKRRPRRLERLDELSVLGGEGPRCGCRHRGWLGSLMHFVASVLTGTAPPRRRLLRVSIVMRMPRPRFTVRWLMIAVAAVALMISGAAWATRRHRQAVASYEERLIYHRTNAGFNRSSLEAKPLTWIPIPPPSPAELDRYRRGAEYHEAMVLKYERALRYPWLPASPDPPEPE